MRSVTNGPLIDLSSPRDAYIISLELILTVVILSIMLISLRIRMIECKRLANYLNLTSLLGLSYFNAAYFYRYPSPSSNPLARVSVIKGSQPDRDPIIPTLVEFIEIFMSNGLFFWTIIQLTFSILSSKMRWTERPV